MKPFLLSFTLLLTLLPRGATCCDSVSNGHEYRRSNCELSQVPSDIPARVKVVNLGNNIIGDIAGAFSELSFCTQLYLRHNELTGLSQGMFNGLVSLEKLHLANNHISDIEDGSFGSLEQCTWLWLFDSKLTEIRVGMFEGLTSLERLYLSYNQINHIERGSFSSMNLRELRLNNDQLINPLAKHDLVNSLDTRNGLMLALHDNPNLHCDNRMCWMKEAGNKIKWRTKHFMGRPDCWNDVNCDALDLPSATVHSPPYTTGPGTPAPPESPAVNIGAIVGVLVAGLIIIIVSGVIIFLKCKGWKMTAAVNNTTNPSYRVGRLMAGLLWARQSRSSASESSYHSYLSVYPRHHITSVQTTSESGYEIPMRNHNQIHNTRVCYTTSAQATPTASESGYEIPVTNRNQLC